MKAGFFSLTAVSLLQLSQAQPAHIGHEHRHQRRDVVTSIAVVTASAPDAVVIQDQYGNILSTSMVGQTSPTPAPAPAPAPQPAPAPVNYGDSAAKSVSAAAAPSGPSQAASSGGSQNSGNAGSNAGSNAGGNSGGNSGIGINYSPYHADKTCKSADEVDKDFDKFSGYGAVRSYGVDCNQVPNIMSSAKKRNMKVMLGIFNIPTAGDDADTLIKGVNGDWGTVNSVSVGNEAVNSGQHSVGEVTGALSTVRQKLKQANYNGPAVIVDTFNTLIANPQLCQVSDFAAANAHSFYDSDITPDQAGKWAQGTADRVKQACGKNVVITESGWPSAGSPNGAAVPSPQNQQTAIQSLKNAFPQGGIYLLSAYNDQWKSDFGGSFGCEKFWGIFGDSPN